MSMLRNRIYYRIKPFIPQSLRTALRRRLASRLRGSVANIWPIMPGSERPPENWPGWPEGKKFAVVLTHDIESAAGVDRCRELMRLERKLGFRSSFNFIPEGNYKVPSKLRHELARQRFEVGIHDLKHDGRLFASRGEFSRKAVRINRYLRDWNAVGFRSGFMLHKLDWLHELKIQYDTSTFDTDPFEPQPEGRHTIFPFLVSERLARTPGSGYVELPYTLPQDSTLFLLLREQTIDIWVQKLDWIAAHGGMVLVDTHPDYMAFDATRQKRSEYSVKLYEQFLQYLQSQYGQDYWHALPREVAAHVTAHREIARSAERNGHDPLLAVETISGRRADASIAPRVLENRWRLRGKRAAVLLFSYYPADPRPLRAAETLAAEGVTIDLFCLQQSPADPKREKINGVNVFRVPLSRQRGGKARYIRQYAAFIASAFVALVRRSLRQRYDLVHVHNMPDALVFSALVPKLLGAKVILDLHDPMPELMQSIFNLSEETLSVRLLKKLEKWSISFSDAVLTVNVACKKIYSGRSCLPEKITVVMNTPDEGVFPLLPPQANLRNNGNPGRPFTLLYHGSLVRRNGFDLAVDALDRVRKTISGAQLLVCGERTSFFDEVMDSARRKGIDTLVDHLGMQNRSQIVEVIRRCDLGVIPNHRNLFTEINTPTRIFEYLALGKPVIAPKAAGILDYFGRDDLIFFELGNADDLARQIEYVYFHPAEVQEIVRRGQEVYLAHQWKAEKMNLLHVASELV
jgi:glycosyltransferase involved in cell wall biosynthesis